MLEIRLEASLPSGDALAGALEAAAAAVEKRPRLRAYTKRTRTLARRQRRREVTSEFTEVLGRAIVQAATPIIVK